MKIPEHLKRGDKVAIVSLSKGMLGEKPFLHKLDIAKERLEKDYGFEVVVMPNALKGMDYLREHPEKRAEDLMNAFKDKSIKAIFNSVGGNDSIRILPYIDFGVIKRNPKIFTGFSDATITHFIMNKAGVASYYGLSVMNNISEYIRINDYTKEAFDKMLINPVDNFEIKSAGIESFDEDIVFWGEENMKKPRKFYKDKLGYDVLQGETKATGRLFGGNIDSFIMLMGTKLWPSKNDFRGKILCIEPCSISQEDFEFVLRNLHSQGILNVINGILIGKPPVKERYEAYREAVLNVVKDEAGLDKLPIIMNVNFGHAEPITIMPFGINCEIDPIAKTITLKEKATK